MNTPMIFAFESGMKISADLFYFLGYSAGHVIYLFAFVFIKEQLWPPARDILDQLKYAPRTVRSPLLLYMLIRPAFSIESLVVVI